MHLGGPITRDDDHLYSPFALVTLPNSLCTPLSSPENMIPPWVRTPWASWAWVAEVRHGRGSAGGCVDVRRSWRDHVFGRRQWCYRDCLVMWQCEWASIDGHRLGIGPPRCIQATAFYNYKILKFGGGAVMAFLWLERGDVGRSGAPECRLYL